MKKQFLIMLCFILPLWGTGQGIDFFREDLTFNLYAEVFAVDGLYYFRNKTATEMKKVLFYPFPDVGRYGRITTISITPEDDTTSMLITTTSKGAFFLLNIPPNAEATYRIKYGQNVISNRVMYIITTTQQWKKPFETASYSLTFPPDVTIESFSIPPDSIHRSTEKTTCYWKRKSFMPDRDFIFTWSAKKEINN